MAHYRRGLDLMGLLSGIPAVGPILSPLLQQLLDILGLQGKSGATGTEAMTAPTTQQLALIEQALGLAHIKMASLPGAVQRRDDATATTTVYAPSSTSSTSASSSTSGPAPVHPPVSPSGGQKAPVPVGSAPKPPVPVGAAPKPPIPAGAAPPSAPVVKDAPPMFSNMSSDTEDYSPTTTDGSTSNASSSA